MDKRSISKKRKFVGDGVLKAELNEFLTRKLSEDGSSGVENIELYTEKVATRDLCAIAQAEPLRINLIGGLAVRRACYEVLRFIMGSGAKSCKVIVSGKLRELKAKSMKFVGDLMIHSGEPINEYVNTATRHVLLQGVLGIEVKIMLPYDPHGKTSPKKPLPDFVSIVEPKDEVFPSQPTSEVKAS